MWVVERTFLVPFHPLQAIRTWHDNTYDPSWEFTLVISSKLHGVTVVGCLREFHSHPNGCYL